MGILRKFKREKQSKDEKLRLAKQKQDAERKRGLARDVLYPILVRNSRSVNDAKNACHIIQQVIQTEFSKGLQTTTLGQLDLEKELIRDAGKGLPGEDVYREVLGAFRDLPLNECLEIIGGMPGAIESFINQENRERKIDTIKTYFL